MQVVCSAAILLTPKNVGPYSSLVQHFVVRLMGQFKAIAQDKISLTKGMRVIGYRASLTASARGSNSYYGPM